VVVHIIVGVLACVVLLAPQTSLEPAHADIAFQDRLAAYVAMRDDFARLAVLPLEPGDVRTIALRRERLARSLRIIRADLPQGNIFSGVVAMAFRRAAGTVVQNPGVRDWVAARDVGASAVERARVNGPLPAGADHEIHPALVAAFPPLPRAIFYRVVHYDLVLWDADADLIVDVLPGVFLNETFEDGTTDALNPANRQ
jgi:hypothetical protein